MKRKITVIITLLTVLITQSGFAAVVLPPTLGSPRALNITATTALFTTFVTSNNLNTQVRFHYATSENALVLNPTLVYGNDVNSFQVATSSIAVTGLAPATKYWVRAGVGNVDGNSLTTDFTFTTDAAVTPTVSGFSLTDLSTRKGILNYSVADGNATTVIKFGTDANNLVNTVVGTAGTAPYNGKVTLTGLTASTQYYYAIEATNTNGTSISTTQTFTTPSTDLVADYTFTNTLANTAGANPFSGGSFTSDRFGNSASAIFFTNTVTPQATIPNIPIGKSDRTISFWFRSGSYKAHPANDLLFSYGSDVNNQRFGAYLNSTTLVFQIWGADFPVSYSFNSSVWNHITFVLEDSNIKVYLNGNTPILNTNVPDLNTSNSNVFKFYGSNATTLVDDLKIYKRAVTVTEVESLRLNNDLTASTLLPSIANVANTNITLTSATVSYTVNANSTTTTSLVKYGTDANNLTASITVANVLGNSPQARSAAITGLASNTTYYYSIEATNTNGTTTSTGNFKTLGIDPPEITNVSTTKISTSYANVSYTLTPNNGSVTSKVKYGLASTNLNNEITGFTTSGTTVVTKQISIPNLALNTVYHYEVEATSQGGTVNSTTGTFTTRATIAPTVEFEFNGNTIAKNNPTVFFNIPGAAYGVGRTNTANNAHQVGVTTLRSGVIPNALLPTGNADRTIAMWYAYTNFNSRQTDNTLFTYGTGVLNQQFYIGMGMPPYFNTLAFGAGASSNSSVAYTPTLNTWNHLVVTMQAEVVKVYINNDLKITYTGNGINTAFTNFSFGNFDGLVDDLKIFDVALSANEVAALNASTLPVNLISYTAKAQNQTAALNWKTASESNNSHFLVKRSSDGLNFAELAKINGAGTNGANYSYNDTNPLNGVNYYQLLQVDNDGTTTDLGVKSVNFSLNASVSIYPNPTADKLYVNDTSNSFSAAKIYDAQGKMVLSTNLKSGSSIDVSALVKGVYFIKLSGNSNETRKFIKL